MQTIKRDVFERNTVLKEYFLSKGIFPNMHTLYSVSFFDLYNIEETNTYLRHISMHI